MIKIYGLSVQNDVHVDLVDRTVFFICGEESGEYLLGLNCKPKRDGYDPVVDYNLVRGSGWHISDCVTWLRENVIWSHDFDSSLIRSCVDTVVLDDIVECSLAFNTVSLSLTREFNSGAYYAGK